jgi:hypothetical protein
LADAHARRQPDRGTQSGKAFEPLRKYSVADSPTWAHPVLVGHGILIKDATNLALWDPS